MFVFLSKLLPNFIYPLGLAIILLVAALIWRKNPRRMTLCVAAALAILWLAGNDWVATSLARSLEWQYLPPKEIPHVEAIVVLSGGTQSAQYPRPSVELNGAGDRVLYAAHLYQQGVAPYLLVTGGTSGVFEDTSTPADDMADLLEMFGVPRSAVWIEPDARNTYENALFSREMLDERGIDQIVLVTSALHMPRSVALFEQQGLAVIPAPTDYGVTQEMWENLWSLKPVELFFHFLPSSGAIETTTAALKEYIGMLVYYLRGWL